MELGIDRVGAGLAGMELAPDRAEAVVVLAPAQGAWAVAGCDGRRLVQKEELGVRAGCHHLSLPATKLQAAGDPAAYLPVTHDPSLGIVQNAAVAHQCAARWHRDNFAKRREPICQWHVAATLAADPT
jgi:hypothetical protein